MPGIPMVHANPVTLNKGNMQIIQTALFFYTINMDEAREEHTISECLTLIAEIEKQTGISPDKSNIPNEYH